MDPRYIIETKVPIKPGKIDQVLDLFKATNPDLVSNESDWIRASFSSNEEDNLVIVRAEWKNQDSYIKFSSSEKFKTTMSQFAPFFAGKPEVSITKVLFEM